MAAESISYEAKLKEVHYGPDRLTERTPRMTDSVAQFLNPARIITRAEVLAFPSPVPRAGGVYGWWFRSLPGTIDTSGCVTRGDLTLLYAGISPTAPPANGRPPSQQTIRSRIKTHYGGNAEGSTLRRTLGCLLSDRARHRTATRWLGCTLHVPRRRADALALDGRERARELGHMRAAWDVERELIAAIDLR